jgi:tRNA threonylcarbamoyladenosine biosynthesis protein TsaE
VTVVAPAPIALHVDDLAGTHGVAAALAARLRPGDLIVLTGELGAGKTALVQGLAGALGVTRPVTSPTFTLVRSYPTAAGVDLVHADLYRLGQLGEVADLGLPESLEEGAVGVVEWGERGLPALPPEYLSVTMAPGEHDRQRWLHLRLVGPAWLDRWDALRAETAAWAHAAPPGAAAGRSSGDGAAREADAAGGPVPADSGGRVRGDDRTGRGGATGAGRSGEAASMAGRSHR